MGLATIHGNARRSRLRPGRISSRTSIVGALLLLIGCGPTVSVELSGAEMLREVPAGLVEFLPEDAVLCHDERSDDGTYRLWILRSPSRTLLKLPDDLPEFQQRRLPASVLVRILDRTAPWLDPGEAEGDSCSFARWHGEGADLQVREILTPNGWYATVEEFAHGDPSAEAPR